MMRTFVFIMIVSLAMFQPAGATNADNKIPQKVIVIDKEKRYPEKKLELKYKERFIRLETNKDILLGENNHVYHVSDKRMLITNVQNGDVFIFDMKGKALFHFNHKGGNGYAYLSYALYDEPLEEVYIVDHISKKICVFSEAGILKRTLHLPSSSDIKEIYNFDNTSLLAFHEHQFGPVTQKQPYMFISKKDGKVLSKLNITTNQATARTMRTEKGWLLDGHNHMGNCKFGQDFILANMSCDTIYRLKQDKTLIPLFVQRPSVFTEPYLMTAVGLINDDFVLFSVYPYDLKASARGDNSQNKKMKYLMYEFKTGKFFEIKQANFWSEKVDIPQNTSVGLLYPHTLKYWLKQGYLKGEWKELAEKVDINDNPVVKIIKYD